MRRARAKLWKNLKEADLKMKAGEKWTEGERKGGGGEREERARKGGREWVREGERERERERVRKGGREKFHTFYLQFLFLELNITT